MVPGQQWAMFRQRCQGVILGGDTNMTDSCTCEFGLCEYGVSSVEIADALLSLAVERTNSVRQKLHVPERRFRLDTYDEGAHQFTIGHKKSDFFDALHDAIEKVLRHWNSFH